MSAPAIRTPKSAEQAAALFARWAELDAKRASAEADRKAEIGRVNAAADTVVAAIVADQDLIAPKLEAWFNGDGKQLLPKDRKSMQLGGCEFGSRKAGAKVEHGFADDDAAVEALRASPYRSKAVKVSYSLDRPALKSLLEKVGKAKAGLTELGFKIAGGSDAFFLKRVQQDGTLQPSA